MEETVIKCQIIIDTDLWSTIVLPGKLPTYQIMVPKETYILETANGVPLPVLGIYEAKFQITHQVVHKVLVAEIFEDAITSLVLIQKYEFKLGLQGKINNLQQIQISLDVVSPPGLTKL